MHLGGEFRVHLGGEFRLRLGGEFIFSIIPVVTLMHCSSSSSSWKRRSETLGIYHKKSKYIFAVQVFVAFFSTLPPTRSCSSKRFVAISF